MVIETRSDVMRELDYLELKHDAVSRAHEAHFDRLWLSRWVAGSNKRGGRRLRASAVYFRAGIRHRSWPDVVAACKALARILLPSFLARRLAAMTGTPPPGSREAERPSPRPGWLDAYRPPAGGRV